MSAVGVTVEDYTPRRIAGADLALPTAFSVTVRDDDRDREVRLAIRTREGGYPSVVGVSVTGEDLAMVDLRAVKLPDLVRAAMAQVVYRVLQETEGGLVVERATDEDPVDLDAILAGALEPPPPGGRRQPVTDERLRQVAERYRAAVIGNVLPGPLEATATSLGLSRSHTATLVRRARAAGLLDPRKAER